MGTQQLLYVVLGLIIVGVAIAVAFSMVKEEAVQRARDSLQNDISLVIMKVQEYYRKSSLQGGGGNSFSGLTPDKIRLSRAKNIESANELWVTANGTYTLATVSADSVVLEGIGVEVGMDDTNPVMIRTIVRPSAFVIVTIN